MDAAKNPDYLRATADFVEKFRDALERFLELHVRNEHMARGVAPAVFPREGADLDAIAAARSGVDVAAGLASAAPGLTQTYYNVEGRGRVDPIAAWHSITQPKPILEPDDILSACGLMIGRLELLAVQAAAEAPPAIGVEAFHPLIWGAAQRLWVDGHHRQAVAGAAEALVTHVKVLTGRNDVPETSLWQQVFSDKAPEEGKPRLRWPGEPGDQDVVSMNSGLRQFAPGAQQTIRNSATHGTETMSPQDAVERLAVLSLLARWVDQCELETIDG